MKKVSCFWGQVLILLILLNVNVGAFITTSGDVLYHPTQHPARHRLDRLKGYALLASSSVSPSNSLFIFGLGYVGTRIVHSLQKENWTVVGTCSSYKKTLEIEKKYAIPVWTFDGRGPLKDSRALDFLSKASHILVTIPPLRSQEDTVEVDVVLKWHRKEILDYSGHGNNRWIGYLSSTSVYGDQGGAWVTESTLTRPLSAQGKARLRAEAEWVGAFRSGAEKRLEIFRIAGIYGPRIPGAAADEEEEEGGGKGGRSALATLMKQRTGVVLDKERKTCRVHVDDIVQVLKAAMLRLRDPSDDDDDDDDDRANNNISTYNVADDFPASRWEVYTFAAQLLESVGLLVGKDGLLLDTAASTASARQSQPPERKLISNALMKKELLEPLGMDLLFPDYRKGLTKILEEDYGLTN